MQSDKVLEHDYERYWTMQKQLIPNGTQTLSKHPDRYGYGYPKLIKSASGCQVESLDGTVYTDFISALGPIILGYGNKHVDMAVKRQIDRGVLFSMPSHEEYNLAKLLNYWIPSADSVKLFKSGSDANSAAIKVARAFTGKERILACGYHGWHDWYSVSTDNKKGIPTSQGALIEKFRYNDIESLRKLFTKDDVAAVIMEPVQFDEPQFAFLEEVRELTRAHGALLIFDEVITGFRLHLGGAQSLYNVIPDLSTFSKAMGNGYPIAALVGKREFMGVYETPGFFVSGTFGGDLVGIAAAKEVFHQLSMNDQLILKKIWRVGNELKEGYNLITSKLGIESECVGLAPRTKFVFPSIEHKSLFYEKLCEKQVLFGPNNFINAGHSSMVIQGVLCAIEESLVDMKTQWGNPKPKQIAKEVIIR